MQQSAQPSTVNYLLSVWTQPRAVVREIIDTDPGKHAIPIVILSGILSGFDSGFGIIFGPVLALIMLYLYAFMLRWIGSWFGGEGTNEGLRAATVWGYYLPAAQMELVLLLPTILSNIFELAALNDTLLAAMIVLTVWVFTITFRAIAEAHRFTVVKAFFTTFIASAILVLPFALIFFFAMGGMN